MNILERAIETYGKDMQLNVAVEELSELIKEICKSKRGRDNRENIIEEMADCYIMLEQLEIIFDVKPAEISRVLDAKIERLKKRLDIEADNKIAMLAEENEKQRAEGEWKEENRRKNSSLFFCSNCGGNAYYIQRTRDREWQKKCPYKFCPNCGARMKGE